MGYFKKGSAVSLMAGLTFGGLLIGSGVLIAQGESYKGHALASGVTGAMTLAMGQRFLSTGKFMPAGMVATIGAVGLAYNVKKAIEWMPEEEKQGAYLSIENEMYTSFVSEKNVKVGRNSSSSHISES
jgi:uncharacterized membrane protein (UPF0136 family)